MDSISHSGEEVRLYLTLLVLQFANPFFLLLLGFIVLFVLSIVTSPYNLLNRSPCPFHPHLQAKICVDPLSILTRFEPTAHFRPHSELIELLRTDIIQRYFALTGFFPRLFRQCLIAMAAASVGMNNVL
jgi:hypothetical protein